MDADLKKLWQIPSRVLGPALKAAFHMLWLEAGCEPNHLVITARWLGAACGAESRTALGWISQLEKKGLISVIERDERRGTIQVFVFRPTAPVGKTRQRRLRSSATVTPFGRHQSRRTTPGSKRPRGFARINPRPLKTQNSPGKTTIRAPIRGLARGFARTNPRPPRGFARINPRTPEGPESPGENDNSSTSQGACAGVCAHKPPTPRMASIDLRSR